MKIPHLVQTRERLKVKKSKIGVATKPDLIGQRKHIINEGDHNRQLSKNYSAFCLSEK
jgi:hypothetical protein